MSKDGKGAYASATLPSLVASELYLKSIGVKAAAVNYRTTADSMNDFFQDRSISHLQVLPSRPPRLAAVNCVRSVLRRRSEWQRLLIGQPWSKRIPGYDFVEFWLVSVPSGTPAPIIEKLGNWYRQIVQSPETAKFLKNVGMDPLTEFQTTVRKMVEDHTRAWKEYAVLAKIEPM